MPEGSDRLERILEHRRSAEERCLVRVRDLRARVRQRESRIARVEAEAVTCDSQRLRDGDAGGLASSQRYVRLLLRRADELREQLRREQERLEGAMTELSAAGQRRLAVERLLNARVMEARRQALAGAQAEIDDSGRLRLMLEED